MSRPIKLFAYRIGDKLGMDVDIIMAWPLKKIYEYMAFYVSETPEWQEKYKEDNLTPEDKARKLAQFLGGK